MGMDSDAARERHKDWLLTMTPAERELYAKVLEYENTYFHDMTFQPDSLLMPYLEYEVQGDDGAYIKEYQDVPLLLRSIANNPYIFHIAELEASVHGQVEEWMVTIDPAHASDARVILHEMAHVYGDILDRSAPFFHDILLLCLYNSLKPQLPGLDQHILTHSHVLSGIEITMEGGSHDVLFFLKSIDLDLRLGWAPGTVCGYGRDSPLQAEW